MNYNNSSEELSRLADLHQRGALSDEEFAQAKARVLGGATAHGNGASSAAAMNGVNALRRSRDDRWLGGVCGGLGRITGMASWVWRLGFTALTLCAGGGILLYILMWIFVPEE